MIRPESIEWMSVRRGMSTANYDDVMMVVEAVVGKGGRVLGHFWTINSDSDALDFRENWDHGFEPTEVEAKMRAAASAIKMQLHIGRTQTREKE